MRRAAAATLLAALALAAPAQADWSRDGKPDVLAVRPDGRLLMYRTDGAGAFVPGAGVAIGAGWAGFTAVLAPGDPRVRRVVSFVCHGPRRVDRRAPYVARLRLGLPAGTHGRVYARVDFRRSGSTKLRHKTVSRRFVICG